MHTKVEAPAAGPVSGQEASVAVRGLKRRFRGARNARIEALAGVDLQVRAGEVVGVVGPSGCGKSTLLELIAGLQEPDAGLVAVAGAGAHPPPGRAPLPP